MLKDAIEIFKNDLSVIKDIPVVILVILAIILIPSLYALLNIQATWDPYSQTSSIKVAVVDEDTGYDLNGTHYNIGNSLVDELKNNRNFSWQFVDEKTALNSVKYGEYYAAIIIPSNFTQEILSIDTTDPQQAKIRYVVNDKLNAVTPRITNAGVDSLQTKINDEVVKTIDGIIFGKLSEAGQFAKDNKAEFLKTKDLVNELKGKINGIDSTLGEANSIMGTVQNTWSQVSAALPQIKTASNTIRKNYDQLYDYVNKNPQKALQTVQQMDLQTQNLITSLKYVDAILTTLYDTTGDENLKPVITKVESGISQASKVQSILQDIESDLKNSGKTDRLAELKTAIDNMDDTVNSLANNKEQISQIINEASGKLALANSAWPAYKNAIQIAAARLNSINESDLDKLISLSDTNLDDVNNYFDSPVVLDKEHMYPVKNYGSALSTFYIPISLWIGGIIAVAMMSMQVRTEKKYHSATIYMGRMGIFLIISLLQGLIVAIGSLLLGVQVSSALIFIFTTLFIGLSCMVIIYSLTSAFGNAGKAIAIIILVLQITASGGVFSVELLPPFYQAIHPFLPVSYAVAALREVVAGIIWSNYLYSLLVLSLFSVLTFVLTLLVKERANKRAQWTEDKLKDSGLF
ncbi:MAG TPA: YhgE/Pip domain-containing protein [Methanobacterium sp.]|nr:YhgE/Pip domain-containing protein [Methanobacterium sp.]